MRNPSPLSPTTAMDRICSGVVDELKMPTLRKIVTVAAFRKKTMRIGARVKANKSSGVSNPVPITLRHTSSSGQKRKKADRAIRSRRRTQDFDFRSRKIVLCDLKIRLGGVEFLDIDTNMGARDDSGSHQTRGCARG